MTEFEMVTVNLLRDIAESLAVIAKREPISKRETIYDPSFCESIGWDLERGRFLSTVYGAGTQTFEDTHSVVSLSGTDDEKCEKLQQEIRAIEKLRDAIREAEGAGNGNTET